MSEPPAQDRPGDAGSDPQQPYLPQQPYQPYGQQPPYPPPPYGQQPPYPPQPYGQPPYAQPPMGPVTTQFARLDPGPSQTFGALAAVLTGIGAVLAVLAFTILNWFEGNPSSHFQDVKTALSEAHALHADSGVARLYFDWLAWALLAVAAISALLAATPAIGGPFRIIGVVVALAGVVVTFLAIKLVNGSLTVNGASTYVDYLKHARIAFYAAVAGFLLIAIGAALGPRNKRA